MSETCTIEMKDAGCVQLTGVMTFESTPGLYSEAEKLFKSSTPVSTIDLAGLTAVDSSGLALLLEWQATRSAASGSLEITHAPTSLMSLARLCNAVELLRLSGRDNGS